MKILMFAAVALVSAVASAGLFKDVSYVTTGDAYRVSSCKLDMMTPDATTGFPTVVWFHGGGLTSGN